MALAGAKAVDDDRLLGLRLRAQGLADAGAPTPTAAAGRLVAVHAQSLHEAAWAVRTST